MSVLHGCNKGSVIPCVSSLKHTITAFIMTYPVSKVTNKTEKVTALHSACVLLPLAQEWQASFFSLQYHWLLKYTGHENKGNDHRTWNVLMFSQILPTSDIRNILRTVRRICMWILGLFDGFCFNWLVKPKSYERRNCKNEHQSSQLWLLHLFHFSWLVDMKATKKLSKTKKKTFCKWQQYYIQHYKTSQI